MSHANPQKIARANPRKQYNRVSQGAPHVAGFGVPMQQHHQVAVTLAGRQIVQTHSIDV